jgi:serine/threonine protein phosphatase PrpC
MLHWSVATDRGLIRKVNEDSVLVHPTEDELAQADIPPAGRMCIVADGLGGHRGGQIASSTAVQKIVHYYYAQHELPPLEALHAALAQTNQDIAHIGQQQPELAHLGTTVVVLLTQGDHAYMLNVGDSRAYLWRQGQLRQLSTDDSWVEQQVRLHALSPDQARTHTQRNLLTQFLGTARAIEPHVAQFQLVPGDRLLLCTDGLTGVLDDTRLGQVLHSADLGGLPAYLIELAKQHGSEDNITAAVGEYRAPGAPASSAAQANDAGQGWRSQRRDVLLITIGGALILVVILVIVGILATTLITGAFALPGASGTLAGMK